MLIDLRCRYNRDLRELAANMFEARCGYIFVARTLGISEDIARNWRKTYRAVGRGGLLNMGKTHAKYDFETKVAAARAVVDGDLSKPEAMKRFEIASLSLLKNWCRLYCMRGTGALRPKPKDRSKYSGTKDAPMTHEQEFEREVSRLEAQVAYLKIDSPEVEALSSQKKALVVAKLSGQGYGLADLLAASGLARSSYLRACSSNLTDQTRV